MQISPSAKLRLLFVYIITGIILGLPFIIYDYPQETCLVTSKFPKDQNSEEETRKYRKSTTLSKSAIAQKLFEIIGQWQNGVVTYTDESEEVNDYVDNEVQGYNNETVPDDCDLSEIEKYSPFLVSDEDVRNSVNEWLGKNGKPTILNRVRLTRIGYGNDWFQLLCASVVFATFGMLWEGHSFHGWAQFYFVSLELMQRVVNIVQTTTFHWDFASVLFSDHHPHYLQYCALVDLFRYYIPLSQLFCLTALTYDVYRTFGNDTLVPDKRRDKRYIHFALFGVLLPAFYTSLGFILHKIATSGSYLCHPSFETLSDLLLYLVYPYSPSGILILLNIYFISCTQRELRKIMRECRVVRRQCTRSSFKPTYRLNLYLKLLWALSILTVILRPFSRTMMAFGVHLERYDGGYSNIVLYIVSRTHSCILLLVMCNDSPTRARLETVELNLMNSLQKINAPHGEEKLVNLMFKMRQLLASCGIKMRLIVTKFLLHLYKGLRFRICCKFRQRDKASV